MPRIHFLSRIHLTVVMSKWNVSWFLMQNYKIIIQQQHVQSIWYRNGIILLVTVCCSDDDDDDDVFFLFLCVSLGLAPAGLWVRTLHTLVSFTPVTSFLRSRAHLFLLFCFSVVEFRDEEFVKKAIEVMNKHDLNGRPLNIKEVNVCSEHASCHAVCNSHTRLLCFSGSWWWTCTPCSASIRWEVQWGQGAGLRSRRNQCTPLHRQ